MVYPAVEEKIIVSGTGLKKIRQIGLGKNMNKNIFAVIMAGGQGERFWPGSRRDKPKQLLNLVSSVTMIEETMARLTHLIPPENIIVMTGAKLVPSIQSLLPELPADTILEKTGIPRVDHSAELCAAGYDIGTTAKALEEFYWQKGGGA